MANEQEDNTSLNNESLEFDIPSEDSVSLDDTPLQESRDKEKKEESSSEDKAVVKAERKYQKAVKRIQALEEKNKRRHGENYQQKDLSEEEKKELQAKEYIRKEALEALKEEKRREQETVDQKIAEISQELDDVLDENPDVTEDQLLKVIEEMAEEGIEVRPQQALTLLSRFSNTRAKPKMPRATQTAEAVSSDEQQKYEESLKNKPFEEQMRMAKKAAFKKLGIKT